MQVETRPGKHGWAVVAGWWLMIHRLAFASPSKIGNGKIANHPSTIANGPILVRDDGRTRQRPARRQTADSWGNGVAFVVRIDHGRCRSRKMVLAADGTTSDRLAPPKPRDFRSLSMASCCWRAGFSATICPRLTDETRRRKQRTKQRRHGVQRWGSNWKVSFRPDPILPKDNHRRNGEFSFDPCTGDYCRRLTAGAGFGQPDGR